MQEEVLGELQETLQLEVPEAATEEVQEELWGILRVRLIIRTHTHGLKNGEERA